MENNEGQYKETYGYSDSKAFLARVYLYFGFGLLVTGLVSILLSYIFTIGLPISDESNAGFYMGILIASLIALLVVSIAMNFMVLRGKGAVPAFFIYSSLMGIALSPLVLFTQSASLLGTTFLATSLLFFLMCAAGYFIKNRALSIVVGLLTGLMIAGLFLYIMNIFVVFSGSTAEFQTIYLLIEFVFLGIMALMSLVDMARIKRISENGVNAGESNLAAYCAYILYTDFVNLFLWLFMILLRSKRN
jgi:FtsH-binding integral membrane protein